MSTSSIDYKYKARVLAEKGVSQENRDEALITILAILGDYSGKSSSPPWYRARLLAGFAMMLLVPLVWLRPRVVIGIGKGQERIVIWRRWIGFLFVFVPTIIILPFLINMLANRLS